MREKFIQLIIILVALLAGIFGTLYFTSKDNDGNHVFENLTANRQPSQIILAVTDELSSLLRVGESINDSKLILVPTNVSYRYESETEITTQMDDQDIISYIEQNKAN